MWDRVVLGKVKYYLFLIWIVCFVVPNVINKAYPYIGIREVEILPGVILRYNKWVYPYEPLSLEWWLRCPADYWVGAVFPATFMLTGIVVLITLFLGYLYIGLPKDNPFRGDIV